MTGSVGTQGSLLFLRSEGGREDEGRGCVKWGLGGEREFKEKNKKIEREQKKEEEVKRKEFFDHMKMQLRPERSWELSEAWKQKIWKKKKGKRKLLMYSATAAACLILVIVLPNLSELLKMSEQEEMSKHENVAFVLEDHSDENKEKMF